MFFLLHKGKYVLPSFDATLGEHETQRFNLITPACNFSRVKTVFHTIYYPSVPTASLQ